MKKYIKSLTALNTLSLTNPNQDEIDRYAESDIFWAANKNRPIPNRQVRKGNIYQFEFGKNYIPEMSYEHRGLVIGVSGKLLYVLPICSYQPRIDAHRNAYHPRDNPESKSHFFLLKGEEFPFLSHDSVLKLNDLRSVSFLRIKYKQDHGFIDPHSETYQAIEHLVFTKYFFNYSYAYDKLQEENQSLKTQLSQCQKALTQQRKSIQDKLSAHDFDPESWTYIKHVLETE